MSTVIFQIQSTLILILFFWGYSKVKSNINLHKKIMITAVIWDILLILQIEFTRAAVEKVAKLTGNGIWLYIHVSFALLTVISYAIVITLAKKNIFQKHKYLGKLTILLRFLTYITSFIALN